MAVKLKPLAVLLVAWLLMGHAVANERNEDPFESWNRKVFIFNEWTDRYVLRPVAQGYSTITPDPVERGISRMFSNLGEVSNVLNSILQGKFSQAANDTGRFLVNSTLGLVGFFDVASHMGLEKSDGEDFGQTLGRWGVPSGPYLVLPLLGSSTVRDTPTRFVDAHTHPVYYVEPNSTRVALTGLRLVSVRAEYLSADSMMSGDRYLFFRDVYLQRRAYLVNDGVVEDDFGDLDDYY